MAKISPVTGLQPQRPKSFAILVFPGFPMMAFSAVIEPLRAANVLSGRTCYSWTTVGLTGKTVVASNGIGIEPDHSVRQAPLVDRIVLCSGGDADQIIAGEALAWIRRNLRSGADVGAVADAAFILAGAGLLDGHACTLHWTSQPAFEEAFPQIDLKRDLYVIDRKRFTSAGGIGSFDMVLDLMTDDYGAALAAAVAEWFVHSPLRPSVDRRLMPLRLRTGIRNELVLAAIAIMEESVSERMSVAALAMRLDISDDKLERAFRSELGVSPVSYYRAMRLRRAHDLLAHSSLPVGDVALSCGFSSASSFSRAFREQYGRTPLQVRTR